MQDLAFNPSEKQEIQDYYIYSLVLRFSLLRAYMYGISSSLHMVMGIYIERDLCVQYFVEVYQNLNFCMKMKYGTLGYIFLLIQLLLMLPMFFTTYNYLSICNTIDLDTLHVLVQQSLHVYIFPQSHT